MKKKFLSVLLALSMVLSLGSTVSFAANETELFNPANASVSRVHGAYETPAAGWNGGTGTLSIEIKEQPLLLWGNLICLNTGITSLDTTKEYQFSFTATASTDDCGGVSFKAFDDDNPLVLSSQNISITKTPYNYVSSWVKPLTSRTNGDIVFDFGWDPPQTVTITNISIKSRPAMPGTEDNPWNVGTSGHESEVKAFVKNQELHIKGSGTIGSLASIPDKTALSGIVVEDPFVLDAVSNAFLGFESLSLTLPDGWQGDLPDEDGYWYGSGPNVILTAYPSSIKGLEFSQRYPWNNYADISVEVSGAGEHTISFSVLKKSGDSWIPIRTPAISGSTSVDLEFGSTQKLDFVWNTSGALTADELNEVSVRAEMDETIVGQWVMGQIDLRSNIALPQGETTIKGVAWSDNCWNNATSTDVTIGWKNVSTLETGIIAANLNAKGKVDISLPKKDGTYQLTHSTGSLTSFTSYTVSGFPTYSITYKDENGADFSGTHESDYPTTHTYGTATALKGATKDGFTFAGWFTDPTCSGAPITTLGANDFSADITLYAKWSVNSVYTITYKDKDGAAFSGTHVGSAPTEHRFGTSTDLVSASKTGYEFGGWFTDSSCTGTALTTLGANDFSADITLYAKWTPILTHVSFEGNAVDCTFQNSVSQLYGEYFVLPSWTPERPNHKFIGWYTAPTGGTKITASTICRNISDATCYAHWQKYTVKSTLFVRAASTLNSKVIKLAWNEISGATKYVVYGNICNKGIKKFATVKGKTLTVKNIGATKIYSHKLYKFVVVAYTPSGKVTSKMIYTLAGTTYKNYSNVTAVGGGYKPNIEKGETTDVSAIYYTYKNMKHISKTYGAPIRFFSNCASVATIDANGVITGKNPGTAMIYVQDIGGAMMKFKVTVTNTPG